jgi:hypothetical protein
VEGQGRIVEFVVGALPHVGTDHQCGGTPPPEKRGRRSKFTDDEVKVFRKRVESGKVTVRSKEEQTGFRRRPGRGPGRGAGGGQECPKGLGVGAHRC